MARWEGPPEVYLNYFVYLILFPESWDSPLPPAGRSSASGHWFLFQHLPRTRSPSGSSPGSRHQGKESCLPIPAPPPDHYPCYFHTGPPLPQYKIRLLLLHSRLTALPLTSLGPLAKGMASSDRSSDTYPPPPPMPFLPSFLPPSSPLQSLLCTPLLSHCRSP